MTTDWYVIVDGDRVFAGMSPTGRLLWESRTSDDSIQVTLFPDNKRPEIIGLPDSAEVRHLDEL